MIERIGPDANSLGDPTYPRFVALVEALQEAQNTGQLSFEREGEETIMVIVSDRKDLYKEERLDEPRELRLTVKSVQFRSFLDVMYSLAKNTDVPEQHKDQVKHAAGNGYIQIRSSANRPNDALVSVRHNGIWFSIANSDIKSKDTFALTRLLYQMQAGDIPTVQPLLTLPVAQP